jgi:hypothetical protein
MVLACCCEECDCELCQSGTCAACAVVTLGTISDDLCSACEDLQDSFNLPRDTGLCRWFGLICPDSFPSNCFTWTAEVTVYISGSDIVIELDIPLIGLWRHTITSASTFDCTDVYSMSLVTDYGSTSCDFSSMTVSIQFNTASCVSKECGSCSCCTGISPTQFLVDFGSAGFISDGDCDACDQIGGSYILNQQSYADGICKWVYQGPVICTYFDDECSENVDRAIRITLRVISGCNWALDLEFTSDDQGSAVDPLCTPTPFASYRNTNIEECTEEFSLSFQSVSFQTPVCGTGTWPSTLTITPL